MRVTLQILAIFILLSISSCKSQKKVQPVTEEENLLAVAKEIMIESKNCALITQDTKGQARVRTMDPFLPEKDFTVWFGTNPQSRKVEQIKKDPRVSLYYFNPQIQGYVTIYGKAELIDNDSIKQNKFKDAWRNFYPNQKESYLLIKVTPESLEILSPFHGINNDLETWKPPVIYFNK